MYIKMVSILKTILVTFITFTSIVKCDFNLTIIHVNDIHVRFVETDTYSGTCKKGASQGCYGGIARLHKAVKDIQNREPNSIFVNGGDFYQGTAWYTVFKWTVVAQFANILNVTAMSPGNHEFDDGVDGYVPFLQNITFPVICANLDVSQEPQMAGLIKPSIVVERGGKRIGIIGFLTPETKELSNSGNVKFIDEVESIRAEAKKLKDQGVKILIAVGHSGYDADMRIAKEVADIDVVVGGHSHSFLYTGTPPSTEKPVGEYPTLVEQPSGKIVPVVQAYAYTKYLGYLSLTFDEMGEAQSWNGSPILLDSSFPEDPEVLQALEPWKMQIQNLSNIVIGETKVLLSPSRSQESNLGNFITDSMVQWFHNHPETDQGVSITTTAAILNSGGIRGSFDVGNITLNDLLTVLPFSNSIDLITLSGATLREAFEFSSSKLTSDGAGGAGAFFQVSGFKVTIDVTKPPGQRITELLIKSTSSNGKDVYGPVVDSQMYNVAMANYMANGGDGLTIIAQKKTRHLVGAEDIPVFKEYLLQKSPVTQGLENRIKVITKTSTTPALPSKTTSGGSSTSMTISHFILLLFTLLTLSKVT